VAVGEAKPPIVNGFEPTPVTALSYVLDSDPESFAISRPGASWLANSPLGTFTFNLTPNISFDGFHTHLFCRGRGPSIHPEACRRTISTGLGAAAISRQPHR